jgi:hypothetical protein
MKPAKMMLSITTRRRGVAISIIGITRGAQVAELEKLNICMGSIAATSLTTCVPQETGIVKRNLS